MAGSKWAWHGRLLAVGVALVLLLAACSSGDGDEDAGTGTDAGAEPESGAESGGEDAAAGGEAGGPVDGGLDEVCAAAEDEGQLVYWNNLENPDPIFEEFNAAYPGIQIASLQLRPDDSAQRVLAEDAAGQGVSADIIYGGQDVFSGVIAAGLVDQEIDWAALGVDDEIVSDTNMVRIYRVAGGLSYNTDELTADDLPDTWEELIDSQWAGQVVVDPRGRPWDQLSLVWGEEETLAYVQEFMDVVQPVVIEGGTAGLVAVAGGEALITTGGRSSETEEQQLQGAPIDIKYLDVVPTLDAYHAVLVDAAHPNAARCWVGWMATEGVEIHQSSEIKANDTVPPAAPDDAEIVAIDTPDKADVVADMSTRVGELMQ